MGPVLAWTTTPRRDLGSSSNKCRQGRQIWRSTNPGTLLSSPRYQPSSFGTLRSAGPIGSPPSGAKSEVPFPDLAGLWTTMDNQEPWEPTFTSGYTLSPNAAYGGGMSSRPTHGPNPSARWTPSETTATPLVTATAPVAPPPRSLPTTCRFGVRRRHWCCGCH